jgi:hypothetical protein
LSCLGVHPGRDGTAGVTASLSGDSICRAASHERSSG